MGRLFRALFVLSVAWGTFVIAPQAQACNQFLVTATTPVTEGEKVLVKIERNNTDQPSSVSLRTDDGSAMAGSDYKSTVQRVTFTNEQQKTIQIPTIENSKHEETESFFIKLSGGQGCSANPDFDYGNPVKVTIKDDDAGTVAAPSSSPVPTAAPPAVKPPAKTPKPSPTPTEEPVPSEEPVPTEAPLVTSTPVPDDDKDINPALVGIAVGLFVLAAGSALALARNRRRDV